MEPPDRRTAGFLRANAWIVLVATVLTVLVAVVAVARRPDTYTSSASVVVEPQTINNVPTQPQMGTEKATVTSGRVVSRASSLLGVPEAILRRRLSVAVPVDTTVLQIRYRAATPRSAQEGAQAFTGAYVDFRNSRGPVADVITAADVPTRSDTPNYALVVGVALLGGLALGLAAALVREQALRASAARQTPAYGDAATTADAPADRNIRPNPESPSPGGAPQG